MSRATNIAAEKLLRERAVSLKNCGEYFSWEKQCDEVIELLKEQVSSKRICLIIGYSHSMNAQITRLEDLKQIMRRRFVHIGEKSKTVGLTRRAIDTAWENRVSTGVVINQSHAIPCEFLQNARELVMKYVMDFISKYNSVKVTTELNAEFSAGDQRARENINTEYVELLETSDLSECYKERVLVPTLASLAQVQKRDSAEWSLISMSNLTVNMNKYNSVRGGCYTKLPKNVMMKRAVVNVKSHDEACFAWSVVAALYPSKRHSDRLSSYPNFERVLNVSGINFPMALDQIEKFEQLNDLSINVYTPVQDKILPMRLTKNKKERHVNVLYFEEEREGNSCGHFAWIKNLSRLVGAQLNKSKHRKFICDR